MILTEIKNYGDLLSEFRAADEDGDGYVSEVEDPGVAEMDSDGDSRVALWELMRGVKDRVDKRFAPSSEISAVKRSMESMPAVSPGNIIHLAFAIQRKTVCRRDMSNAFRIFNSFIERIKKEDYDALTPVEKMNRVREILLKEFDFKKLRCSGTIAGHVADTFVYHISSRKYVCMSISLILYAAGRELGWPIHVVEAPHHVFVRWSEGGTDVNYEATAGYEIDDEGYGEMFDIADEAVQDGVYLDNLTESEILAEVYYQRSLFKYQYNSFYEYYCNPVCGDAQSAFVDINRSIELNPLSPVYYAERSFLYKELGRHRKSKEDRERVIEMDPAYYERLLKRKGAVGDIPKCRLWRGRIYY